jgi:acyl carrier protein
MNQIFVDSLERFSNVCNGCFKTIYTLAVKLAREKGIRYIVTGLSRGQFFETRLTADVFRRDDFDVARLDEQVLEARKAYHRREDAVSCHLEADVFRDDEVFRDIQFVDFYRYWSVTLEELYDFLGKHAPWTRPSDTGRSTNCLINEVGIAIHKKQRGYHNYALPYSWDVRLGQKTRDEAIAELDDDIDETRVREIMTEIGYAEPAPEDERQVTRLAAYYVSTEATPETELRAHLARDLPAYMLPAHLVRVDKLPLTVNGKVDRDALPRVEANHTPAAQSHTPPNTETEKTLADIWRDVLRVSELGIDDDFFDLGGQSLTTIQVVSRIRSTFGVDVPLRNLYEQPTVAGLAAIIDRLAWVAKGGAPESANAGDDAAREEITL